MAHIFLFREFKENSAEENPLIQLTNAFTHLSQKDWITPTVNKDPKTYIDDHLPQVLKEYEKSDTVIETLLPNYINSISEHDHRALSIAQEYKDGKPLSELLPDHEDIDGDWEYELEQTYEDHISNLSYTLSESYRKNNYIEVWRTIGIGHRKHEKDIYTDITKNYRGTGIYWAWDKLYSEAHWTEGGEEYILHGYLRPQDIDWHTTLSMNVSYTYQEEHEVRTEKNTQVLLIGIYDQDDNYHKFDKPLIVPTSQS